MFNVLWVLGKGNPVVFAFTQRNIFAAGARDKRLNVLMLFVEMGKMEHVGNGFLTNTYLHMRSNQKAQVGYIIRQKEFGEMGTRILYTINSISVR